MDRKSAIAVCFIGVLAIVVSVAAYFNGERAEERAESPDPSAVPTPLARKELSFICTGDIMLSRVVGNKIRAHDDPSFPFEQAEEFLSSADLTFGNLENPVSARGKDVGSIYSFRADPRVLDGLSGAGFDAVSIANNHIWDWGADALSDTAELLLQKGIVPVGAGRDYAEANDVRIIERNGMKIGLYAYTNLLPKSRAASEHAPGLSEFDEEKILDRIRTDKEKKKTDISIVSMHWGEEYAKEADAFQKRFARKLIDAGADIVVGHHPHVPEEAEWYEGKLILYSLGNLVFDQNFSADTMSGLIARVRITPAGMEADFFKSSLDKEYRIETIEPVRPVFIR